MLRCPHCGAGVGPTASACTHCNTALLLKACPRCLSRVFHGHDHCPTCGTTLARPAEAHAPDANHTTGPCPRCDTHLEARLIGDIVIDECGGCHGVFLDALAIERVIADRRQARAEALLGALPSAAITYAAGPNGRLYVKCPACATIMNRKQFATGAGVIVDVCKKHGTFFDKGELPAIIQFVMNGGLEKAAATEVAREREHARAELARARDMQRDAARLAMSHEVRSSGSGGGAALIDLLFNLWR